LLKKWHAKVAKIDVFLIYLGERDGGAPTRTKRVHALLPTPCGEVWRAPERRQKSVGLNYGKT